MSNSEAEEFASIVKLKLIENDYEVLRRFRGRSTLRTYLAAVVQRAYLDFRVRQWGKWRPSAEARRLGPLVVRLEQLLVRDGMTVDQAFEVLTTNHGVRTSREELSALSLKLPIRMGRRFVGEEALLERADPNAGADAFVVDMERSAMAERLKSALERSLERLDPQDRLIVRMRFEESFSIAGIAEALRLDHRRLYRRVERILERLRSALGAQGVLASEVAQMLERPAVESTLPGKVVARPGETVRRPSTQADGSG